MSFPSGSTLLVTLQNGASPNTGPFDLYINSTSSSANLITTASVSKTQLSSSGYTFNNNVEVFSVWAKSSGSITTANVASLGNISGTNKSISVTGSYGSSLTPGLATASIFFNNGYGLQNAGNIPSNLNTCPSTTGVGTGSINGNFNTLVVCKTNETSSEYVKFFTNESDTSVYYYQLPCVSSSGTNETSLDICVDLTGGNYQTVATNSINVYPSTEQSVNMVRQEGFVGQAPYGNDNTTLLIRVNGSLVYSGSSIVTGFSLNSPGNALVEVTSSIMQTSLINQIGVRGNFVTNSLSVTLTTPDNEYFADLVVNKSSTEIFSGSTGRNDVSGSFIALPGALYTISATQTGNLIYSYMFNGLGNGYNTKAEACAASTGGPSYYTFWQSPSANNTIFYTNIGMTSVFAGNSLWYAANKNDGGSRTPVLINNSGLVIDYQGPC
jgi:hypothetical protein